MPSEPVSPKAYEARSRTSYQSEASSSVGTFIRVDFHRFGFAVESGNPGPIVATNFSPSPVIILGVVEFCNSSWDDTLLSVSNGRSLISIALVRSIPIAREMRVVARR